MRIVVTGATGYVGSRLVPELLGRGHQVVATTSGTPDPARFSWGDDVSWARMDARHAEPVQQALQGADALVYLVHSLSSRSFSAEDAAAAEVVAAAVGATGVERVVYLSGLVPQVPHEELSEHISSRLEVEEILSASAAGTLTLRAGMLIGAGSTSFEIMRQISAVSLVQAVPPWMGSLTQPISVADVITYLADALERPEVTGHLDIGAPEVLTYTDLLALYATVAGTRRPQVRLPFAPAAIAAQLAPLAVAAPWWTVSSLVHSLQHDMVVAPGDDPLLGDRELIGTAEAIRRSLRPAAHPAEATTPGGDPHVLAASDPGWVQPPRWNGRLPVIGSLVAAVPVLGARVETALAAGAHVIEHRLRPLTPLNPW